MHKVTCEAEASIDDDAHCKCFQVMHLESRNQWRGAMGITKHCSTCIGPFMPHQPEPVLNMMVTES